MALKENPIKPKEDNFTVTINFRITKNGEEFSSTTQTYSNMSYDNMQVLQRILVTSIVEPLLSVGDLKLSEKAKEIISKIKRK